jgi:sugar phosphate isomerase/epimerase
MHGYPKPPEIDRSEHLEWLIERAGELGLTTLHVGRMENDPGRIAKIREMVVERDIELELGAPGIFELVGPNAAASRERLLGAIEMAKQLDSRILRTGYGRLNMETSRFSRTIPLQEHLAMLIANLKEAGKIFADNGLLLAIENHCDFSGKEFVTVFSEVDSPAVGCALDTANGYTVYCDANEDVQDLAPFAFTTHMKDMKIVDLNEPGRIPMIAVGTAVGEGDIDIPLAIDTLAEKSPCAEGLHLIVETGWNDIPPDVDRDEYMRDVFHRSISYLQDLLGEETDAR